MKKILIILTALFLGSNIAFSQNVVNIEFDNTYTVTNISMVEEGDIYQMELRSILADNITAMVSLFNEVPFMEFSSDGQTLSFELRPGFSDHRIVAGNNASSWSPWLQMMSNRIDYVAKNGL